MQIVINISEEYYNTLKKDIKSGHYLPLGDIYIANGTPLSKRHNRMIDADELIKRISDKCKIPSLNPSTINGLCGAVAIVYDMLIETGQETEEVESEDKE